MHKLLQRQIRRVLKDRADQVPEDFLQTVDHAYRQADEDRKLLERAMDLTSEELLERNDALNHSLSLLESTLDATHDGILVTDRNRRIQSFNRRFVEIWDHPEDMLDQHDGKASLQYAASRVKDPESYLRRVQELYEDLEIEALEEIELQDGKVLERYSKPILHDGELFGRIWSFRDVTEQRRLEEQMRRRQKMEAVGQLAGGIAHDFNNLLTVITGCCDLSRRRAVDKDSAVMGLVEEIAKAAGRASDLTSQLLSFSRQAVLEPKALCIDRAIRDLEDLLHRLLGDDVRLRSHLHAGPATILADPTRFQQIVLNLVINARDALENGGEIHIRTEALSFEPTDGVPGPCGIQEAGAYGVIRIADNGCGIPPELQQRIFEPFFTTKAPGKGTGLGLATVYGIVKQFHGILDLESQPGNGTEFRIAFPLTDQEERPSAPPRELSLTRRGTILAVEDDPAVRMILTELLCLLQGFEVHIASSPAEALERFAGNGSSPDAEGLDLLISDIAMPEMNGFQLADRLAKTYPRLKVLFVSGYDPETSGKPRPHSRAAFLSKPFDYSALKQKIQETLADPACYQPSEEERPNAPKAHQRGPLRAET